MANLSLQKRERMLAFINQLREQHKTDDDVLISLSEIENDIIGKKYGLVWEEHEETVNVMMQTGIPVFSEIRNKQICLDKNGPYNFILEGDNLHSLYLLEKTCKENVDCIYIDPPYNTGAKDWKYNNDYVEKKDLYRHSKWLSMMGARLRIAKKLLKDDGVLICAIDENELGTTLLLLDDIFGQGYSINPIVVIHNPRGVQGDNFSYVHEYEIFVYRKGYKVIENQSVKEDDVEWSPLRNWGSESERHDAANCFYPILVKDDEIVGFGDDVTNDDSVHPRQCEYNSETNTYSIYPIDTKGIERKWRYARQTVESIQHLLRAKKTNDGYDIEIGKDFAPYKTVWTDKKFDANEYGTQLINSMIPNNDFSFPKSVHNTYECLRAVTLHRPNALIVDFFAGSGTTGHATLMLNKELGGNRRFILCTNNDVGEKKEKEFEKKFGDINTTSEEWINWCEKYGIAASVTYPRIKSAITGFVHTKDFKNVLFQQKITPTLIKNNTKTLAQIGEIIEANKANYDEIKWIVEDNTIKIWGITKKGHPVAGIPANLKYYTTTFVPRNVEYLSDALLAHIKEMVQLEHGVNVDGQNYLLILDDDTADEIESHWSEYPNLKGIYISRNVLLTSSQNALFSTVTTNVIPDYYFNFEMKEVGESW